MAVSTVREDALLEDVSTFSHAVLAYVAADGHPINVATDFTVDHDRGTIRLTTPSVPDLPSDRSRVNVIFSHIRPAPGVGYDQRRYVSVWGPVSLEGDVLEITPERSHGWDEERLSFFELCERSVPVAHEYMRKLSAEQGRPVKTKMSLGWLIFLATRVPFLTATIVPVVLGAVVARSHGFSAWWLFLLALVGASAVHLALNVSNDVFDTLSGTDTENVTPTMYSGGSRMIQYGLVSLRAMAIASVALYAVGIAIGLYLTFTRGIELLWIGITGIFLAVFYTAPPLRLVHRGVGEIAVALGFGPIMVLGTYFVIAQRLSWEAAYASLPVAILIMLVLYVNQIPDKVADAKTGKRTVVVRFTKQTIVAGYRASVIVAFGLIVVGALSGIMPVWTLVALAPIPLAAKVYRALGSFYESPYELMAAMGQNVMLHLFVGLLLIAGYVVEILV